MTNPFDRFDQPPANPFDRFDTPAAPAQPVGDGSAAVGRGLINGIPIAGPTILSGLDKGVARVRSWQSGLPYEQELQNVQQFSEGTAKANPWATTGGEIAGAILGTAPAVAAAPAAFGAGGGGLAIRSLASGMTGSAIGGADAAARGGNVQQGAVLGGLGGFAAPGVAAGIGRLLAPTRADPVRQALVDTLRREGVEVSAGQASGSNALRYAESGLSDLPLAGGGARALADRQAQQFNAAAARRMGETADNLGPEVMTRARDRIGQQFDDLSARNALAPDQQFARDLGATLNEYARVLPSEQRGIVNNLVTDVVDRIRAGGGTLPGADYQTIRSRLSRMAQSNRQNDPEFAGAIRGIRTALDDSMGRSIAPADQAGWQIARREYGAMKVLERAMNGRGESTAAGNLSPQMLRSAVSRGDGGAYVRGQGDFADLARAGAGVMQPMPQSGTAPRASIAAIISSLLSTGAATGSPGITAAGVAAAAGPSAVGRALMSRPVQGYLMPREVGEGTDRVVRALLAANPPIANQQRIPR